MKQCRECGTLSSDETVFCYVCGTKFPELSEEVKRTLLQEAREKLIFALRAVISIKR